MTGNRHGLALPVAVFSIAIIVLFVAGSAFAATQEARASQGLLAERFALEHAEFGASAVLRDWKPAWNVVTPVGQTLGPFTHAFPGGSAVVRLTRTSVTTWWIVSEGTAASASRRWSRRVVNAVVRLNLVPSAGDAALAVMDSAGITGSGIVDGNDSVTVAGICASLTSIGTAGVAAPDTTRIVGLAGILGMPPLLPDSNLASRFHGIDSAAVADIVLPAGAVISPAPAFGGGVCDTLVASNWGDPAGGGLCGWYFPVIRALGDVTVRGGSGQGLLIAAGDVVLENGASFHGLVMARDDFMTGAGGGSVNGAVMAADARRGPGDHSVVGPGGRVTRSACRLFLARLAASFPQRVTQRWWAEFH